MLRDFYVIVDSTPEVKGTVMSDNLLVYSNLIVFSRIKTRTRTFFLKGSERTFHIT